MRFFQFLVLIAGCLPTVMGALNNSKCPKAKPLNGSTCSLPQGVSCKYKPFTCLGSPTTYLSRCSCTAQGKYKCIDSKPPTCKCPSNKPTLSLPGRCTVGTKCRYNPVGCKVGVKFATNCECVATADGINKYECKKKAIQCRPNDADCPASKAVPESRCDPKKVQACNYEPYGCPGGKPGSELFVYQCLCDPTRKRFACVAASLAPCD